MGELTTLGINQADSFGSWALALFQDHQTILHTTSMKAMMPWQIQILAEDLLREKPFTTVIHQLEWHEGDERLLLIGTEIMGGVQAVCFVRGLHPLQMRCALQVMQAQAAMMMAQPAPEPPKIAIAHGALRRAD